MCVNYVSANSLNNRLRFSAICIQRSCCFPTVGMVGMSVRSSIWRISIAATKMWHVTTSLKKSSHSLNLCMGSALTFERAIRFLS